MVRQVGMKAFPNPISGNQSFGGILFTDLFASRHLELEARQPQLHLLKIGILFQRKCMPIHLGA